MHTVRCYVTRPELVLTEAAQTGAVCLDTGEDGCMALWVATRSDRASLATTALGSANGARLSAALLRGDERWAAR